MEVKTKAVKQHISKLMRLSNTVGLKNYYVVSKEFVDNDKIIQASDL